MSTCISREGEYGEHIFESASRFTCSRCFVFDEDVALHALAQAEARSADMEARIRAEVQRAGSVGVVGSKTLLALLDAAPAGGAE